MYENFISVSFPTNIKCKYIKYIAERQIISVYSRLRNDLLCVEWDVKLYPLTRISVLSWSVNYILSGCIRIIQDLLGLFEETVEDAGDRSEQFAVGLGALSNAKNGLERFNVVCHVLTIWNRHRLRK